MTIKCYKLLSNWLSWVVLILMMGTSPIIQAATDCDAVTEISKGECESLLELYNSTDGANWTDNSGWNVTNTPCSWFGVTCENGGVDYISLSDNQLSGSIPDFSALPNLTSLYLSSNQLCKDKNTNYGKWQSTVNQYPDCPTSEPQTYTLSTSSDPENGGSVSRSPAKDSYNHNETVILTAIANSGYDFVRWQDDATGNNSTTSVTMDSDKTITVIFKANTHRLLISYDPENGGSVSRSPAKDLYIHNETVNLTASPNQCYKFTGWGDACSGSSSCELIMDRDKSVIANFKIKSFKLNISSDNGIVKRQPNKTLYDCGETVELIATPNKGYEFTAWSGDVNSTNKSITVNMDTDLNLKAMFIVTAELKVTPSGPLTLSFGESIELTASGGQPPYNWTITDGKLTSKEGTRTTYIAPKIAGDNTITLTDDRGEKVEVKVKVIGELVCSPTVVTVILGDPNPVTFKAAGGAEPYKWSADNGLVNPIEGPETNYQPPAQTGDYHVTCKDNKDNSIKSLVRVVPSVAITPAQIDLTKGETVTLEVAGGQEPYIWTAEAGTLSSTSGSRVSYTAPKRNGVYSVTVTDSLQQEAKARIEVLGNLIISPIKTFVTIGENIRLSAARGAKPYTWPDGKTGRTWNTKFTQVGRQEVVVTDAAGDSGLAIVEVIHAELGLTPQTAYLHPSEVINFSVTGGTSPYAWSAEAGTLSNLKGQRVGYVAPEQPGEYTITVADGRDKVGQAKVTVTAGVTDIKGKQETNQGVIRSKIIIDGIAHHSDHILTDGGAHVEISFPLTMPNDGQKYNTYGAILWTPPQAEPVFFFRTTNVANPFQVFDGATFPVYQATSAGDNVVIDIYRGALNGLSGQFDFYAGYAPTTATNVLDSLLFNSKPFRLEVK